MEVFRAPVYLRDSGTLTPLGDSAATHAALLAGKVSLTLSSVTGQPEGDRVPLSLIEGRGLQETLPPVWEVHAKHFAPLLGGPEWGTPRRPVVVTSSNFGVGSQFAYRHAGNDRGHLGHGAPARCVERLGEVMGWGNALYAFSHACVSAHIGLLHAARLLDAGFADEVLVFSFDFLSPFVTGGFHALKILNGGMPTPFSEAEFGSVGLGDGLGYAILSRERSPFCLTAHATYNEMHHFTANRSDGSGFDAVMGPLAASLRAQGRMWLKGHGTGTVEAGRLEAGAAARHFAGSPLVGWKGSLGHTLGSCGLVELALVVESIKTGIAPGTVAAQGTPMTEWVAREPFSVAAFDHVVCLSNAFGGAHAGFVLTHG